MKAKHLFLGVLAAAAFTANAEEHLKSLNPGYFDPSTPASEDFYLHVNKGWLP